MEQTLQRLHAIDNEIQNLNNVASVLHWDQETYMPEDALAGRAEQLALLQGLIHDRQSGAEIGEALAALGFALDVSPGAGPGDTSEPPAVAALPARERAFLRQLARVFVRARRLPRRLVTELARETAIGQRTWLEARQARDFSVFSGQLGIIVALVRETSQCLGYSDHPYDPLLDDYEPWMKTAEVDGVFRGLRTGLSELAARIADAGPPVDTGFLKRRYPVDRQREFSLRVLRAIGYDFRKGRLDESAHPFTTRLGGSDVRLTTRFNEHFFNSGIFGTVHECGHGLYELGVEPESRGTLLGEGASMGIHESQSRTWENLIGRSHAFWRHFYPQAQELFPDALEGVDLEDFYRGINAVERSLIRVEADEVTYNLHIILRFELEKAVLEEALEVRDLPGAWNDRSRELLGVEPRHDGEGVLQDIHWSSGAFGYFPTYALGNLYAAQFFAALRRDLPGLDDSVAAGSFAEILDWQRDRIHRFGRRLRPGELCRQVTGEALSAEALLAYLENKFGEIYGI